MHIDNLRERAAALHASAEAVRAMGREFDLFLPSSINREMLKGTSLHVKEDGTLFGELFKFPVTARRNLVSTDGMFTGFEYRWFTRVCEDEVFLMTSYLWLDQNKITLDADRRLLLVDRNNFYVAFYLVNSVIDALLQSPVVKPSVRAPGAT